jgi:hypothetical protein
VEQEVEEVASAIGNEAMRHYAATAILAVLAVGCWTRVRAVSRKHAETTDDSSESGDA